jgi:hypothetical protein
MKTILSSIAAIAFLFALVTTGMADIKVRQKMTMGGQTFETTKMIKKSRQRTEQKMDASLGAADFMSQVATITQCDLRRTVQVNDSKKLYFVEPFAEESSNEQTKPVAAPQQTGPTRRGGTLTMSSSIRDTGERQTLFGLQARHIIIVMEMESSADSCNGASKTKMEMDGWYVDFSAEFSCPFNVQQAAPPQRPSKPGCVDRIVMKGSGGGDPGFLLNGTMKFYDASGNVQMAQTIETLELSRATLADSLFNVPQDYKLVSSSQELYSMPNMADLMRQQNNRNDVNDEPNQNRSGQNNMPANAGAKTVGLNITVGSNAKVNQSEISQYLQDKLRENDLNGRVGTSGSLDYVLNVEVKQVKESAAGKVGGLFGKVTGVDAKVGKTDVELIITLTAPNSTTPITQNRVAKKFDGNTSDAIRAAIDEAMDKILAEIDN